MDSIALAVALPVPVSASVAPVPEVGLTPEDEVASVPFPQYDADLQVINPYGPTDWTRTPGLSEAFSQAVGIWQAEWSVRRGELTREAADNFLFATGAYIIGYGPTRGIDLGAKWAELARTAQDHWRRVAAIVKKWFAVDSFPIPTAAERAEANRAAAAAQQPQGLPVPNWYPLVVAMTPAQRQARYWTLINAGAEVFPDARANEVSFLSAVTGGGGQFDPPLEAFLALALKPQFFTEAGKDVSTMEEAYRQLFLNFQSQAAKPPAQRTYAPTLPPPPPTPAPPMVLASPPPVLREAGAGPEAPAPSATAPAVPGAIAQLPTAAPSPTVTGTGGLAAAPVASPASGAAVERPVWQFALLGVAVLGLVGVAVVLGRRT